MAMASDRAVFLDYIKEHPLTIIQTMETFNVSRPTARNWTKHSEVELIPGSYPHTFRHKASNVIPGLPAKLGKKGSANGNSLELPDVPDSQLQAFFEKLMADETPAFHFNEEFRSVDSIAAINEVERKLISCLLVTRYYKEMMIRDGVQ